VLAKTNDAVISLTMFTSAPVIRSARDSKLSFNSH
jgi:hypothetical protein